MVPDEFMRVQWTRLKGGAPTPQFVELVKRLLDSPRKASAAARPASRNSSGALPKRKMPASMVGLVSLAALAIAGGLYYFLAHRGNSSPQSVAAAAEPKPQPVVAAPAAPNDKSVAVLPFANMSPDKDNEFFADGMHEDVITNLTKIRELKVISRSSVLAYRDASALDLKKIAADLGVATILEGSVRRVGSKVRVTARLIEPRSGTDLWAESYDRDVSDIFSVQAEIAQQIASALKANLSPGERELIEARPTQDQEAYDLYLRAHNTDVNTGLVSREDMDRAVALYEGAIAKDPKFALAYVQLSIANSFIYWFGYLDPSPERRKRVEDALSAAIRLAPDLPGDPHCGGDCCLPGASRLGARTERISHGGEEVAERRRSCTIGSASPIGGWDRGPNRSATSSEPRSSTPRELRAWRCSRTRIATSGDFGSSLRLGGATIPGNRTTI